MSEISELLTPAQQDRVNADLTKFYGVGDTEPDSLAEAKERNLTEVLYRDLPALRAAELPLLDFYVRVFDGKKYGACSATKAAKYVDALGYRPADTLEAR